MPKANRPLKVFLSYASQDKPLVRELSRRLVGEGWIDTWQDEKNLLPGQDWRVKIEEAVEEADIVIICLSTHSVSKEGNVQKELRYAREIALEKPEDTIFLIPLRLDDCEVPRGLRFYQWVDYFGEMKTSSYKALIDSLKLCYKQKLGIEEEKDFIKKNIEAESIEKTASKITRKELVEKERQVVSAQEVLEGAKEKISAIRFELVRDFMILNIVKVDPDDSISSAQKLMKQNRINSVLIPPPRGGGKWQIITQSDILLAMHSGENLSSISVSKYASIVTIFAHPDWTIEKLVGAMVQHGVKHMPVMDDKRKLVGIISSSDIINYYAKN